MAKKEEKSVIDLSEEKQPKGERKARWEALLAEYKLRNPVKYEEKEKAGEFKDIPDLFV